jgi:predicted glycosyltransferase
MHDAMAYAKMFVGDGQSMAMEAAILGTPSIRCNTFVGKIAVYEEMENKYGLKYGFLPQDGEKMLQKIEELLNQKDLEIIWQQRRAKMLAEKINVANWIASLAESYQKQ